MIGTVKITRVRFLEDEIFEGSLPHETYENATVEEYEIDEIEEAVRAIQREGLTFAATGNDWAANPDGTRITDYATAEREETTAHLVGFQPEQIEQIMLAVG